MDITVTLNEDEEKILRYLAANGPVSVVALGEGVTETDGTQRAFSLDRLERFGLVQRADGTTDYEATEAGQQAVNGNPELNADDGEDPSVWEDETVPKQG